MHSVEFKLGMHFMSPHRANHIDIGECRIDRLFRRVQNNLINYDFSVKLLKAFDDNCKSLSLY